MSHLKGREDDETCHVIQHLPNEQSMKEKERRAQEEESGVIQRDTVDPAQQWLIV
jgi:hypothetical protein